MNDDREFCNCHPNQLIVGVCPFCLNEKLLVVAAEQDRRNNLRRRRPEEVAQPIHTRKPSNGGLLALGSFLSRLELRRSHRRKSCDLDDDCGGGGGIGGSDSQSQSTSASLGDSFISIKFEEDGVVSWDKSKGSEASWDAYATTDDANIMGSYKEGHRKSCTSKTSVGEGPLRWRKRIGHLLQLVRGKRLKKPH